MMIAAGADRLGTALRHAPIQVDRGLRIRVVPQPKVAGEDPRGATNLSLDQRKHRGGSGGGEAKRIGPMQTTKRAPDPRLRTTDSRAGPDVHAAASHSHGHRRGQSSERASAPTTTGSNWLPEQRRSSASAASVGIAGR